MKIRIIIITLLIAMIGAAAYWFFFMRSADGTPDPVSSFISGFSPFGRTTPIDNVPTDNTGDTDTTPTGDEPGDVVAPIPVLRLLSDSPVGGYTSSTTASTTLVRWVDRGRGNVYEARGDDLTIETLSNTLLPHVYESTWDKNATAFMASLLGDNGYTVSNLYAQLIPTPKSAGTSTASAVTPFQLRGKNLPGTIISYAASPKKDKIFMFAIENGRGIGYTAPFTGGTATKIFDTPITQVNIDWPEENTIAITTKGSAAQNGFLYFVDPKTGAWKKKLGPLPGLSAKVSHDARYILVSVAGNSRNVLTSIYAVATSTSISAVVQTLADKCIWGNFYKNTVYCAVPFSMPGATYPDDWYKGVASTNDKIWQINASSGEVRSIASLFDQADRPIDVYNLTLDTKDAFLYFMNKNDLTLWSLDLVSAR